MLDLEESVLETVFSTELSYPLQLNNIHVPDYENLTRDRATAIELKRAPFSVLPLSSPFPR